LTTAPRVARAYHYPGNVRELCNIIERAAILSPDTTIGPDSIVLRSESGGHHPFFEIQLDDSGQPPSYDAMGNAYIDRVVRFVNGNRSQAARLLGLSYPTVMKKLEEHATTTKR